MKLRFNILFLLAISLFFISCDKDEDKPAPVPEVVGRWELDYVTLVRGFGNNPQEDLFVNGYKLDPFAPLFRDAGFFLISTLHLMENNNAFVSVDRLGLLAETSTGRWDYTNAPKLKLTYDDNFERELTYSIVDGLEQLHFNEVDTDSLGNETEIQLVFHR